MSSRNNRKVTYLTDQEAAKLSEWADETDKSESHLLREAVLEYLDHDRTARMEDRLDRIESKIDEIPTDVQKQPAHTHKPDDPMIQSSSALEKARSMIRRIQSNHDAVVKADAVERVIEDEAGIDDRTIAKYKDIFRRRGLLFEHPGQPQTWTTESDVWLEWMSDFARLNGMEAAEDVGEDYPAYVGFGPNDSIQIELNEEEIDA